jgi:hypothetical protein
MHTACKSFTNSELNTANNNGEAVHYGLPGCEATWCRSYQRSERMYRLYSFVKTMKIWTVIRT